MKKLLSLLLVVILLYPCSVLAESEPITIVNVDKVNIRNEQGQSLGRVGCYTPVTVGETKDDSTYVTVSRAYLELSQDNYELNEFINKYSGDISGWVKTRCLSEVNEDMDQVIRKAEEYRWEFWVDGIYHEIKADAVTKNKSYETHSTPTVDMVPIDSRFLRNSSPSNISSRISKAQKENPNYSGTQNENSSQPGAPYLQPTNPITDDNDEIINLNKYVTIEIFGFNTASWTSVTFDREQFILDNINKIKFNSDNYRAYQDYYGNPRNLSAAAHIVKFISVHLSKSADLSNGDQVDIVWNIDEKRINDYFVLDYKYSPQSYTVSNLPEPEPEPVDPIYSETQRLLGLFMDCWMNLDYDGMLYYCSPDWISEQESPQHSIFKICENKTPVNFKITPYYGTESDISRTLEVSVTLDNGTLYIYHAHMLYINDTWYVDPASFS